MKVEKPPDMEKLSKEKLKTKNDAMKYLIKKDFMEKFHEFNKKYLYYDELKYRTKDKTERDILWLFMKSTRSHSHKKIRLFGEDMKYSMLSEFFESLHKFDKMLAGNIKTQKGDLGLRESYIINSLIEEGIASSTIEGATTTRNVAKEMIRNRKRPKNLDENMILNNYQTMKYVHSIKDKKLTPEILLEIQKKITENTLDIKEVGSFRKNDDIVVGNPIDIEDNIYKPPSHKKIKGMIQELCNFANSDSKNFIHPIIKGIIIHFLIGYIHPFSDGNGRTARSVFYWYILSKGYWLFEYISISRIILNSKRKYDLAYLYTEYDEMDLNYFIKYNIKCIDKALKDLMIYINKNQSEQVDFRELISKYPDLNQRQVEIFLEFKNNPNKIFTITEMSERYKIVYQTARTDLMLLNKKRMINKKISGKAFAFFLNTK